VPLSVLGVPGILELKSSGFVSPQYLELEVPRTERIIGIESLCPDPAGHPVMAPRLYVDPLANSRRLTGKLAEPLEPKGGLSFFGDLPILGEDFPERSGKSESDQLPVLDFLESSILDPGVRIGNEERLLPADDETGVLDRKSGRQVLVVREDSTSVARRPEGGDNVDLLFATEFAERSKSFKVLRGLLIKAVQSGGKGDPIDPVG
jgi:hypothetical protein